MSYFRRLLSPAKTTVTVPTPDVAWWKPTSITSPCPDSTGNGHDLTVQSGATFTTGPNGNGAIVLNGSEILQAFPGVSSYPFGTFCYWFKTTANSSGTDYAMWSIVDPGGSHNGVLIGMTNPGNIFTSVKDNSGDDIGETESGTGYNDGNWHHVAVTFGQAIGSTNTMYIDGSSVSSSGPTATAWAFAGQSLNIGNSQDTFWTIIPMTIADMRMYNEQLSGAVIAQMYANGAS